MNPLKYSLLNGSYNMETCALRFSSQSQSGGRGFGLEDHEDVVGHGDQGVRQVLRYDCSNSKRLLLLILLFKQVSQLHVSHQLQETGSLTRVLLTILWIK